MMGLFVKSLKAKESGFRKKRVQTIVLYAGRGVLCAVCGFQRGGEGVSPTVFPLLTKTYAKLMFSEGNLFTPRRYLSRTGLSNQDQFKPAQAPSKELLQIIALQLFEDNL